MLPSQTCVERNVCGHDIETKTIVIDPNRKRLIYTCKRNQTFVVGRPISLHEQYSRLQFVVNPNLNYDEDNGKRRLMTHTSTQVI